MPGPLLTFKLVLTFTTPVFGVSGTGVGAGVSGVEGSTGLASLALNPNHAPELAYSLKFAILQLIVFPYRVTLPPLFP